MGTNELQKLTPAQAEQFLTRKEREVLGGEHLTLRVDVPVRSRCCATRAWARNRFGWEKRGFQQTEIRLRHGKVVYDAWQKDFDAGRIGLGIHSFSSGSDHYLVTLAPEHPGDNLKVTDLYPPELQTATFKAGVEPYVDQPDTLASVPPELEGQLLIRTDTDYEEDARFVGVFRTTQYRATQAPDQIVLTWSEDPRTSRYPMAHQHQRRTRLLQYQEKPGDNRVPSRSPPARPPRPSSLKQLRC